MNSIPVEVLRLLLAILLGGLIGLEREYHDKTAGFRTIILICMGAALFTMMSIAFSDTSDPARIAAQIVTGVGFLGAGAILREGGRIVGLTTAALIWLAAAIGMTVGAGKTLLAVMATGFVIVVLWVFPKVEHWIDNQREIHTYEITFENGEAQQAAVDKILSGCGMRTFNTRWTKSENLVKIIWTVRGKPEDQQKVARQLLASDVVKGFQIQE